jgi:hypothetical protein
MSSITESRTIDEQLVPFGSLVGGSCVLQGRWAAPSSDGASPYHRLRCLPWLFRYPLDTMSSGQCGASPSWSAHPFIASRTI